MMLINNIGVGVMRQFARPIGGSRCDTSERATSRVRDPRFSRLLSSFQRACEFFAVMLWVDDVRNFGILSSI